MVYEGLDYCLYIPYLVTCALIELFIYHLQLSSYITYILVIYLILCKLKHIFKLICLNFWDGGSICNILCVIFQNVVLIFIVSCNTTFQPLHPPTFLRCPLFIWLLVWFLCLMAYQSLKVIQCLSHPSRKTAVGLFNP